MAMAFKWLNRADASGPILGTAARTLHTATGTTVIKEIIVKAVSACTVTLYAVKAGGVAADYEIISEALEAGETKFYSLGTVLETGDTLQGLASVASSAKVHVSGMEV